MIVNLVEINGGCSVDRGLNHEADADHCLLPAGTGQATGQDLQGDDGDSSCRTQAHSEDPDKAAARATAGTGAGREEGKGK